MRIIFHENRSRFLHWQSCLGMPRRVAGGGEGSEDGNGVYCFIRDLIVEGKDAKLVNGKGRFVINWSRALDRYADYKAKKNPQFKCKKYNRRTASNGLRSALLNFYKKEGAKEYKESKQVNEKDEVVERQFQMPPRVFASLFGEVQLTEKSEEDRQETSSTASEGEMDAQVSPNSSSSDTGFDELMDMSFYGVDFEDPEAGSCNVPGDIPTGPCLNVVKTEEDGEGGDVFLTDTSFPSQMFDDASALDSALEEICSDGPSDEISEDMDLLGVVQDICPTSGSVKGGYQFNISLTEQLPDDVTSGIANFEGVASVKVHKLNPFTLSGTVPAYHQPGDVPVTVVTQTGQRLGMTCFRYVDEMREMVRQLVKDPALQSLWFAIWSQEHGFFGNDSNIAQVLGPLNVQDQDSSSQTKQQQSLKVLQLLVYTAAQTDALQFIEMIFSTSAGQVVFNSYKDRTPLPEDVARANGHEDLAQYLQDVNIRLSKQVTNDVQTNAIDWLELVKAVQNQASVAQDKSSKPLKQSRDNDDNLSEYFADAETSSCGSFDLDDIYHSDSDNKESTDKEPCTSDGICKPEPSKGPFICEEGSSSKIPVEKIEPADSKEDEGVSKWGFTYSLSEWLNKWRKKEDNSSMPQAAPLDKKVKTESSTTKSFLLESLFGKGDASCEATVHRASKTRTAKPKEHGQHNHARSPRKTDPGLKYRGALLVCVLVTVLVGLKLGEGQILHWAVGSGYTRISKLLLHCGLYVDAPGFLKETPLHLASKNGFKDLVDILVKSGGNVNAQNFPKRETPLHLAAQNGHQYIAEYLIQHGSKVNIRNVPLQDTPLHLASRNGYGQVVDILLQHGGDVSARNAPSQNTPLHLAAQNGHRQVADILVRGGSDVNARNFPRQQSPLHLAAQNGHQHIVEFLIQHGGKVNSRNVPWRETPPHFAAQKGREQVADILVEQGSDVNAQNFPSQETPLYLASKSGHQNFAEWLQHGRKINIQNVQGKETPLHLVSQNGHRQVADILLQHGSDVRTRSTPLQHTLRHHVAQNGHKQVVGILVQNRSDVNAQNLPRQETPLRLAAQNGHQHIAEFLIQHGSKVNSQNVPWQETSLRLAAQKGHQHTPEVLIWPHDSHFIAQNVLWQETCPHLAAQNERKQLADTLLGHRSDVSTRGSISQNTPLLSTSINGHTHVADGLIQHGSNFSSRHKLYQAQLHLAVQNGYKHIADALTGNGTLANFELLPSRHPADQCGWQEVTEFSLQQRSNVNSSSAPFSGMPPQLKARKRHKHVSEILPECASKNSDRNKTIQISCHVTFQYVTEVLPEHKKSVNTNAVPFRGTPVHVVTKNDDNQPLTGDIVHQKGEELLFDVQEDTNIHDDDVPDLMFGSGAEDEHHNLLKELDVSGNNNIVPLKIRCRHFKANIKVLETHSLKGNREKKTIDPFDINCKTSLGFSKQKRNFTSLSRLSTCLRTNAAKECYQKLCCQEISSFWNIKQNYFTRLVCLDHDSLEKRSLESGVWYSFLQSIGETLSFNGLIWGHTGVSIKTKLNEQWMDNVLLPDVNSYNHCQPRFTKAIKLVVVIGALLTLCIFVTLHLWCRSHYSFGSIKTTFDNGYGPQMKEEEYIKPMGCAFKVFQQWEDLGLELFVMQEDNQTLHLDDLPMNHASPKELRMERLRFWLTNKFEEELLCVDIKGLKEVREVREVPEPEQQLYCMCRNYTSGTLCAVPSSGIPSMSPASPVNKVFMAIGKSLKHASSVKISDICKKLEDSRSSSCPINIPLQPANFVLPAFVLYNHYPSKWTVDQMRCLENHVEVSNEDRGKLQFNFGEVRTVLNGSGAIITVCLSKAIQDNGWLCDRCLIDVLAGTQGNISGPLCVQCAKVTNSRGWVIYTEPPSKNKCCRNVKCVGFIGMLKDVTGLSTATKKQGASSSVLSHRVLQAMQWKSGVPSEGELLIIGHQLKNIGDKFESSEDNRRQQSKNETEKDSRNSVKVPTNAIKFFCGNRVKDPWL